ncbi:MAG: NAD-dependent epimerase/dehydratase family protein [Chloroflexi bacterium]|nr:NAD-dependent epimerase/dehydratase family protein [Chloroflexota bacterium]
MLTNMKVLVTGATGFIGGRTVERLMLEHNVQVRALVRNFAHAARLARFQLEMVGGEASDAERADAAVAGCDIVFHCAHDFGNPAANLASARAIAEACLRHNVKRLVYLSSFAVYEPLTADVVDETTPLKPTGWDYADNKQAIEQLLLDYAHDRGLPVVILLPTIVYGPYSIPWTIAPVQLLRKGPVVLPNGGEGVCNAVYVDDVVDAMLLAATADGVTGERFLISGPKPVTWGEFYGGYARHAGLNAPVTTLDGADIANLRGADAGVAGKFKAILSDPIRLVGVWPIHPIYLTIRSLTAGLLWDYIRERVRGPALVPDQGLMNTFSSRSSVRIEKARRLLGYAPRFDFERGMRETALYVKWANL